MKRTAPRALLCALLAAGALAALPAGAADSVRPEVGKPLQAAQALIKQHRGREAMAEISRAEAVPNRTAFENQVIAQLELHANTGNYEKKVYMLPKHLDEQVARLHLGHLGVKLTTLTPDQADYIGVPVDGPYKPDHYRY